MHKDTHLVDPNYSYFDEGIEEYSLDFEISKKATITIIHGPTSYP
jgi:hypothetical protein